MSGNEFTIGHSVVLPANFANVGSFAVSSLLAGVALEQVATFRSVAGEPLFIFPVVGKVAGLSIRGACEGQFSSCLDFPPTRISHERNKHALNDWKIYNAGKRGLLF